MNRKLDIKIYTLYEIGEILRNYLNMDYDFIAYSYNDNEKINAFFIWDTITETTGKLILWTKEYRIGEIWNKKINFKKIPQIYNDWLKYKHISTKDIINLRYEIIKEINIYNHIISDDKFYIKVIKRYNTI